jgi:group I intron endonuclease
MLIYKTTNLINGKFYIGKDSKNSKTYLGSGIAISKAITKYGKENFTKEIIEVCENLKHLSEREIYWIDFYDAVNDINSYNMANGGQGGDLSKFKTKSTKGKTYEEMYGKEKSDEIKKLRSEHFTGENNPMFGKTLSKEHIQKMNEGKKTSTYIFTDKHKFNIQQSQIGKTASQSTKDLMSKNRTGKTKNGLSIIQFDENGIIINEFKSKAECSSYFNIPCTTIGRILDGSTKKHNHIHLKYKNGII